MRLTDEMVELDDRKYRDRNVLVELKYMGREIKHRKAVTNDDLRFMAWLYRSSLNLLKEQETADTGSCRIFQCKKCGFGIDDMFVNDEEKYQIVPRYCPNCGRSVK